MKFSIGLVYYSGISDLQTSLSTLLAQEYENDGFEILLKDHSQKKEAFSFIENVYSKEVSENKIRIFPGENTFHSGGHNFLISKMKAENYICASIDMKYETNMLLLFERSLKEKPDYDCFTGKLLGENGTIDSVGIDKTWYFQFYDRGQGENKNKFSESEEVFGATGALFCMRKPLFSEIAISHSNNSNQKHLEIFNENLHYKNDVDLMCRLHLLKKKCWYDSATYGIHKRNIGKNSVKSEFAKQSSLAGQQHLVEAYASYNSSFIPWWGKIFAWGGIIIKKNMA